MGELFAYDKGVSTWTTVPLYGDIPTGITLNDVPVGRLEGERASQYLLSKSIHVRVALKIEDSANLEEHSTERVGRQISIFLFSEAQAGSALTGTDSTDLIEVTKSGLWSCAHTSRYATHAKMLARRTTLMYGVVCAPNVTNILGEYGLPGGAMVAGDGYSHVMPQVDTPNASLYQVFDLYASLDNLETHFNTLGVHPVHGRITMHLRADSGSGSQNIQYRYHSRYTYQQL